MFKKLHYSGIWKECGSIARDSAQAKDFRRHRDVHFEELVLFIKIVKAISNTFELPQVFINGERIGGAEDLEKHYAALKIAS